MPRGFSKKHRRGGSSGRHLPQSEEPLSFLVPAATQPGRPPSRERASGLMGEPEAFPGSACSTKQGQPDEADGTDAGSVAETDSKA